LFFFVFNLFFYSSTRFLLPQSPGSPSAADTTVPAYRFGVPPLRFPFRQQDVRVIAQLTITVTATSRFAYRSSGINGAEALDELQPMRLASCSDESSKWATFAPPRQAGVALQLKSVLSTDDRQHSNYT
jgi:hypothetical protein